MNFVEVYTEKKYRYYSSHLITVSKTTYNIACKKYSDFKWEIKDLIKKKKTGSSSLPVFSFFVGGGSGGSHWFLACHASVWYLARHSPCILKKIILEVLSYRWFHS